MSGLRLQSVSKIYENQPLLSGIDLEVNSAETVCLLGASGSGKSTLLRIIAGLERADGGRIFWDGDEISNVPSHRRRFGFMFQDYALFPHLTVADNIGFGLKIHGKPQSAVDSVVRDLLDQFDMAGYSHRSVHELSGGEQQRVALARTLAPQPRLLLLDEPLAALDRSLRKQLLEEIRLVLHRTGTPAIYVTHDQDEAFAVADRLLLLADGHILQDGSAESVYQNPLTREAASFFGLNNHLPGQVISTGDNLQIRTAAGGFVFPASGSVHSALRPGMSVILVLRKARLDAHGGEKLLSGSANAIVKECQFSEGGYRTTFKMSGLRMVFVLEEKTLPGQQVCLTFTDADITILPNDET